MINEIYLIKAIKDYNYILKINGFQKSTFTTQYKDILAMLKLFTDKYIKEIENDVIKPKKSPSNIINTMSETITLLQQDKDFEKIDLKDKKNTRITNDLMALVFEILLLNTTIQTQLFACITGYYTEEDKKTTIELRKTLNEYYKKNKIEIENNNGIKTT